MIGIYPAFVGPTGAYRRASLFPFWTCAHLLGIEIEETGGGGARLLYGRGPSQESIDRAELFEQIKREDEELLLVLTMAAKVINSWAT